MAIKPILFNTEMVRAILDGRKTCTRRVIKAPGLYADPNDPPTHIREWEGDAFLFEWNNRGMNSGHIVLRPPFKKGDILYVRETWSPIISAGEWEDTVEYAFKANPSNDGVNIRWRPSIHMPKKAARIFLRVTDVRVETLCNMTISDLQKEGVLPAGYISQYAIMTSECFEQFKALWDSTIKLANISRYGWDANPWVWVIEFERCEKPEVV